MRLAQKVYAPDGYDLCAYALLRTVCEQGIRGETVNIRLPIDQIHEISASHQLENKAA